MSSYQTKIVSALSKLGSNGTASPDKSNSGTLLADAFLWDTVEAYAKKRSAAAWDVLEKELDIKRPEDPGSHILASTPSFVATAKVSQPVRRFSVDELAKAMKAKYRVPEPTTKEMCEQAKVPGKPSCAFEIVEK